MSTTPAFSPMPGQELAAVRRRVGHLAEAAQVHLRRLVRAVLRPHDRVHGQLGAGRAPPEDLLDAVVLVSGEPQLGPRLRVVGGAGSVLDGVDHGLTVPAGYPQEPAPTALNSVTCRPLTGGLVRMGHRLAGRGLVVGFLPARVPGDRLHPERPAHRPRRAPSPAARPPPRTPRSARNASPTKRRRRATGSSVLSSTASTRAGGAPSRNAEMKATAGGPYLKTLSRGSRGLPRPEAVTATGTRTIGYVRPAGYSPVRTRPGRLRGRDRASRPTTRRARQVDADDIRKLVSTCAGRQWHVGRSGTGTGKKVTSCD